MAQAVISITGDLKVELCDATDSNMCSGQAILTFPPEQTLCSRVQPAALGQQEGAPSVETNGRKVCRMTLIQASTCFHACA
eukprot:5316932-Alexandrium_andersonii.AAC.1